MHTGRIEKTTIAVHDGLCTRKSIAETIQAAESAKRSLDNSFEKFSLSTEGEEQFGVLECFTHRHPRCP